MKSLFQVVHALRGKSVARQRELSRDSPHRPVLRSPEGHSPSAADGKTVPPNDVGFDFAMSVSAAEGETGDLAHKRKVLIVEDSYLLAELLGNIVRDCGLGPVGPVSRLQDGCRLAEEHALDGALLDLKLGGDFSFPIAAILKARRIPFVFVTGWCGASRIPPEFSEVALLRKPFENDEVRAVLASIVPHMRPRPSLVAAALASVPGLPLAAARCADLLGHIPS